MPYDPNKPQEGTSVDAAEMRAQLQGLHTLITEALNQTSNNSNGITTLNPDVSDPPTQGQVLNIVAKLNELIEALRR
jgi:hypothetical protein